MDQQNRSKEGNFVRTVTDERVLFSFRAITVAGTIYFSIVGTQILRVNDELRQSINDFKYSNAVELGTLKGQVTVIDKRIDAHTQRLDNADHDRQMIWARVYELVSKTK